MRRSDQLVCQIQRQGAFRMRDSYLSQNLAHHELFTKLLLPASVRHLAAWRLVSKLMDRNPGVFVPVSGHYPTGDPLIWLVHLRSGSKLAVNEAPFGSVTPFTNEHVSYCPVCDALPNSDSRIRVTELLVGAFLEQIAADYEACLSVTPSAIDNESASGARLILELIEASLLWNAPLRATGLFYDWGSFDPQLIGDFPSLSRLATTPAWPVPEDDRFEAEYIDLLGPLFIIHPGSNPADARFVVDVREMVLHEKHGLAISMADVVKRGKTLRVFANELLVSNFGESS